VRLWRTVPLDRGATPTAPGGALWFPREQQGHGRHDNPDLYGCLYVAEDAVAAVAEPLAAFRGSGRLSAAMLTRLGWPLALAELALPDGVEAIDLDDPDVLVAEKLRPSRVATRARAVTQRLAAEQYRAHSGALGMRWWSVLEASWINWTLFDRAAEALTLAGVVELRIDDAVVREAGALLGLS
jgi:hypothetical protein